MGGTWSETWQKGCNLGPAARPDCNQLQCNACRRISPTKRGADAGTFIALHDSELQHACCLCASLLLAST
jgi:hypothetical protein